MELCSLDAKSLCNVSLEVHRKMVQISEKWLTLTLCSKQDKALRVISAIKLSCDSHTINDGLFKTAMAYRVHEHQARKNSSNFCTLVMSRGVTLRDLCYKSGLVYGYWKILVELSIKLYEMFELLSYQLSGSNFISRAFRIKPFPSRLVSYQ